MGLGTARSRVSRVSAGSRLQMPITPLLEYLGATAYPITPGYSPSEFNNLVFIKHAPNLYPEKRF